MNSLQRWAIRLAWTVLACGAAVFPAAAADNPFLGNWALTLPGGAAGWLGITESQGQLQASILWGGGSVLPAASVRVEGDTVILTRATPGRRKAAVSGDSEVITGTVAGDTMHLTTERRRSDGKASSKAGFTGKRIPPLPPAPDLAKVQFGAPIRLFNGKDLSGWQVMNPGVPNGWRAEDGVLVNDARQEPGKHRSYANIRTEREFEDFHLALEVRVPKGGNSGVYLRGIYEVQVADTHGKAPDSHNMGAIYSRLTPTVSAEKPAGEWQSLEMTLVDRHVTVVLNGTKIIDNQPLLGCTGGALWSDEFRPGPIYLQGDHTSVDYRNIVLRPVVK